MAITGTFDSVRSAAAFDATGREPDVIKLLGELGFEPGAVKPTTITVLDTFDGRLHQAGLRLLAVEADRRELVLTGEDTTPAHVEVNAIPQTPADIPPGPFRSRLAGIVGLRVLLPQIRLRATRTAAVLRDQAGKVVAEAEFLDTIGSPDHQGINAPAATIEIRGLPGYDGKIKAPVAALAGIGLAALDNDPLTEWANATGVDLYGFTSPAVVLDPGSSAITGFRVVLAGLATEISANWQGVIDQTDPEFLHDLRIAVRRTRTVLGESKGVVPAEVLEPVRAGFAWLAGLTGTPRDLDVYLLEWSRYVDPLGDDSVAQLEPVRDLLERRRAECHAALEGSMRSERAADLMTGWQSWLAGPVGIDASPRAGQPLGRLVAKRIARAHRTLVTNCRLISPDSPPEQVHDLRKDAKKLRYLLECFAGLLPGKATKRYVRSLKALQDNLGEHQDAEVHVEMLRGAAGELHSAGAAPATMVAIGRLTERLDRQRLTARAEFQERFAKYDTPRTERALEAVLKGLAR